MARKVNLDALRRIGHELLEAIGEDTSRDGLQGTPDRWARWWAEFIDHDAGKCDTAFETSASDEMVVVTGMRVWSLCEHHLLPFWCDVSIGYIVSGKVLGLSKFARIARAHGQRLQIQEQLVADIGNDVMDRTGSVDVAVVAAGTHLCMAMRGVRVPATMKTSFTRGAFRESEAARSEFMKLAGVAG